MTEVIQREEWTLSEEEIADRDRRIEWMIAEELSVRQDQVHKTIALIDEGNTIPFIARYRKEVTGSLDDGQLRLLEERLNGLRSLEGAKEEVLRKIYNQGKLTDDLRDQIQQATTVKGVEDLYLPFRPKRKTRASLARDRGLEGLAALIRQGALLSEEDEAIAGYLSEELPSAEEALQGARDILAEDLSESALIRDFLRKNLRNSAMVSIERQKEVDEDKAETYRMYFDLTEPLASMPAHRILAMNRGVKEGVLKVKIQTTDERNTFRMLREATREGQVRPNSFCYQQIEAAVEDSYKRLLLPSIEKEVHQELTEAADRESIRIFGENLRPYLMQPPLKDVVVMGLDPGFRTGCKLAVIGTNGAVLDYSTIYPTAPKNDVAGSIRTMKKLIDRHGVGLIAIGNGTASRETEQVVSRLIAESPDKSIHYAIVNESGASIYSASKLGEEEFPDLDVTIRGAISIARRIQDPLAELVKIEPKHIGVGQYQHDVNQKLLEESLEGVVESCVNAVGVNVNTASPSLLSYISGISKSVAKNIVSYKEEIGAFRSRQDLKKVKGLGPKAFEQSAGFLRIPDGEDPLDNTAVHPESYSVARNLLGEDPNKIDIREKAAELGVGIPTLTDIISELKKPGRDPRDEMPQPVLRSDVLSLDDLEEGMELQGTVRNVVAFGCFVDIGVKQDGLVHISELGEGFYKDASKIVQVSDIVSVKIISIDRKRERIGLSMKDIKQSEAIENRKKRYKSR